MTGPNPPSRDRVRNRASPCFSLLPVHPAGRATPTLSTPKFFCRPSWICLVGVLPSIRRIFTKSQPILPGCGSPWCSRRGFARMLACACALGGAMRLQMPHTCASVPQALPANGRGERQTRTRAGTRRGGLSGARPVHARSGCVPTSSPLVHPFSVRSSHVELFQSQPWASEPRASISAPHLGFAGGPSGVNPVGSGSSRHPCHSGSPATP